MNAFGELTEIISSVRSLTRQGLAFRCHESNCGNLEEFLNLRENDCPVLKIRRNTRYMKFSSWAFKNDFPELMVHVVVRPMRDCIRKTEAIATIVDGIPDIAMQKQEVIALR